MLEIHAAEYLVLKPGTLRKWRWNKEGPVWYKIRGAVRYKQSDLDKFLKASAQVNG